MEKKLVLVVKSKNNRLEEWGAYMSQDTSFTTGIKIFMIYKCRRKLLFNIMKQGGPRCPF